LVRVPRGSGWSDSDRPETWHVQWVCGFYPGSNPGDDRHGTAASFEAARIAFETAWREYLPKRTETDFQEWRDDAAWHAAKYARWERSGGRRDQLMQP
jgi:hypothetical protein